MTRFRKWLLTASITLALLLPLGSVASADPSDGGLAPTKGGRVTFTTDPSDGGLLIP